MIVMKFGGTSVGSAAILHRVTEIVGDAASRRPLVVVSAASRVTDLLLRAAHRAAEGDDVPTCHATVVERQVGLLRELALPEDCVRDHLDAVLDLLKGIGLLGELTPRTLDRVASYGELMSARVVALVLRRAGLPAQDHAAWEFGMLTDSRFGTARPLPEADAAMRAAWDATRDEIPVVTGFVGKDAQGHVTTLGRGGSDLSASLFGTALGAEEIQIWTDVSGIMTCDPRIVPAARPIGEMSFEEAAELAYFGAKVLHPGTIEPATRAGIPVVVKNTGEPGHPGTFVLPQIVRPGRGPVAIALSRGIREVNVNSTGMLEVAGFLARVFEVLGRHGIPVDVVSTSEVNVSFTVDVSDEGLRPAVDELSKVARVTVMAGRSIICLVGEGLKETPGVAALIFRVVGDAGVNVEMISQGASGINITFVVRDEDCELTVRALHARMFEEAVPAGP